MSTTWTLLPPSDVQMPGCAAVELIESGFEDPAGLEIFNACWTGADVREAESEDLKQRPRDSSPLLTRVPQNGRVATTIKCSMLPGGLTMMRSTFAARLFLLSVLCGNLIALSAAAEPPATVALVSVNRSLVEWTPVVAAETFILALSDPRGRVRTYSFGSSELPTLSLFDSKGRPLPDGTYTW